MTNRNKLRFLINLKLFTCCRMHISWEDKYYLIFHLFIVHFIITQNIFKSYVLMKSDEFAFLKMFHVNIKT